MLAADLPVLNRDLALEAVQGNLELLTELTQLFRESAAENLTGIQRAVAAGNATRLQLHAHSLKGAASALAGERVAALASELEQLASRNELGPAGTLTSALVTEVESLNLALAALSADGRTS